MVNVIALGNRLRGDDGIGPVILQHLENLNNGRSLNLVEAASDAFVLLEYLNGETPNIVIDCADMGQKPGTVRKINLEHAELAKLDTMISLHGISFAEVYAMAKNLGPIAPTTVVGIQPESVAFGETLSARVRKALPEILDVIIKEAEHYAQKNSNHRR